jgi:mRNA (guanine-N7-)-methyltransferase
MDALRRFHNRIKERALEEAMLGRDPSTTSLLDLACGPGTDMFKWDRLGIKDAMGLDASESAIMEARKRNKSCKSLYRFVIADVCNRLERYARQDRWDIITCNFAMHYLMQDATAFGLFLDAVVAALKPGGVFIGTVLNGDRVENLTRAAGSYKNSLCAIRTNDGAVEFELIGKTYYFEGGASLELLVRPEDVITPALSRGLRLKRWCNFPQYIMEPKEYGPDESVISNLYDTFAFQKTRQLY